MIFFYSLEEILYKALLIVSLVAESLRNNKKLLKTKMISKANLTDVRYSQNDWLGKETRRKEKKHEIEHSN